MKTFIYSTPVVIKFKVYLINCDYTTMIMHSYVTTR